jgi:hypothetical protein
MPAIAFSMGQDSDENYLVSEKKTSAFWKSGWSFFAPLAAVWSFTSFQSRQILRPSDEFSFHAMVVYLTTEK